MIFKALARHVASSLNINGPLLILALLTVFGGLLRFYNLNWDQGHYFHPDERNINAAVSRIHFFDDLDPEFFAYGSLPIYVYRVAGEVVALVSGDPTWVAAWGKINVVGRFFSALVSVLTIPAIYLLTVTWFSSVRAALYAATVATFAASLIQTAHFAITESLLTLLTVLAAYCSYRIYRRPVLASSLVCGLVIGVAVATKMSALLLLVYPLTAHFLVLLRKPLNFASLTRTTLYLFDLLAVVLLCVVLFAPYTFLRWDIFRESMRYESGVAMGRLMVPYTLQFVRTTPYLFQLANLVWQLGPVALASIMGLVMLPWMTSRLSVTYFVLFLSFPLVYFLFVGAWHTKFIRFMVPILPFLIIGAGILLDFVSTRWRRVGRLIVFVLLLLSALWGLAFFSIYTREQTRISASAWIYEHVPDGSLVLREHWDDGLPLPLTSDSPESHGYQLESLTIYEPDDERKLEYYSDRLSQGDYLVINSRRLYGTLLYMDDRYPITSRYYRLLFAGNLGYVKVAEFSSYPSLLGFTINDDASEETFQVYDHPKVMIFENRGRLRKDELTPSLL